MSTLIEQYVESLSIQIVEDIIRDFELYEEIGSVQDKSILSSATKEFMKKEDIRDVNRSLLLTMIGKEAYRRAYRHYKIAALKALQQCSDLSWQMQNAREALEISARENW